MGDRASYILHGKDMYIREKQDTDRQGKARLMAGDKWKGDRETGNGKKGLSVEYSRYTTSLRF